MPGLGADTAVVFEEGDVADVVVSVFDPPVLADRGAEGGGGQADLGDVEGRFFRFVPKAGSGVLVPGQAGDTGGGGDQPVPVPAEAAGDVEGLDPPLFLAGDDPPVGSRPAQQGQHREQQQVRQRIPLALGTPGIRTLAQGRQN